MAKRTLLDLTQSILSDMSSDEVNSISDTTESEQVAKIVLETFRAMVSNRNWKTLSRTFQLTGSANNLLPTHMKLPDNVKELISIMYDKARTTDNGKIITKFVDWKEPDDFLRFTYSRNSDATNVDTITDPTGVKLLIINDQPPRYYTTFDDETIVMDAYDSAMENSLQASRSLARGYVMPTYTFDDDYIPELPDEAFSALFNEALSVAQFRLNTMQDAKAEQEATRQQRWLSRRQWRVKGGVRYPDYGRKSRKYMRDPTLKQERN